MVWRGSASVSAYGFSPIKSYQPGLITKEGRSEKGSAVEKTTKSEVSRIGGRVVGGARGHR